MFDSEMQKKKKKQLQDVAKKQDEKKSQNYEMKKSLLTLYV